MLASNSPTIKYKKEVKSTLKTRYDDVCFQQNTYRYYRIIELRLIIPISRNFFLFSCLAVWRMTTIPPCKQSTGLLLSFSSSHWQSVPTSSEATCPDPDSIQTKPRMTSNGGSGGDYQAVEASETRRKRINQVVWKIQSHSMLNNFFKSQTLSLC